jgi:Ca2+-binding RTX toxin-like protein
VNTYTTDEQSDSSVTALPDGGWVVTWASLGQQGAGDEVYQQRYDALGNAVGGETRVNAHTAGIQWDGSVAALTDGGWVVSWMSANNSTVDIYQQRYDDDGHTVGGEIKVTTNGNSSLALVTALNDGGWVTTWSALNGNGGDGSDIYQQRYDQSGVKSGDETLVNSYTTGQQIEYATAALADGGWIVTWTSTEDVSSGGDIYQQRYDADGDPASLETRVNTATGDLQAESSVTALSDGGWLVTWSSSDGTYHIPSIHQQRYDETGAAVGGDTLVSTDSANGQGNPCVAALADGGWVVVWEAYNAQDGDGEGIFQQRYDADGNAIGGQYRITDNGTGDQRQPAVTALSDGGWVVSWTSDTGSDGDDTGVYQRHFAPDIVGTDGADRLVGTGWGEYLAGGRGNDKLDGKGGADDMYGGPGNDIFIVDNRDDVVEEGANQGNDTVRSSVSYTLSQSVERLVLTGTGDIDGTGNSGKNVLIGNSGDNVLKGGNGADTLIGGKGIDTLDGGYQADLFQFRQGDTGKTIATADTIDDFYQEDGDRIDLSLIDARKGVAGDQAFSFIGSAAFHDVAGELRAVTDGTNTYVYGDTNGDGTADLVLRITRSLTLQTGDFVL